MDDFVKQLKRECLEETQSNLLSISNRLSPMAAEDVNDLIIQEIFRLVHTIKGNFKAIDLHKLATITHHFEDLLIKLRNKKTPYSQKIHDACLEFCDRMDDAIEVIKSDFAKEIDFIEFENFIKRINGSNLVPSDHSSKNAKTIKILIAEDDDQIRDIIAISLGEIPFSGLEVEFVKNGLEAFKKLHSNSYDFLITDLNMPKMDGESLIELWKLKVFPNHCKSILIITGDEHSINSLSLNEDGLFTLIKPFSFEHLSKLLKLILGTIKLHKE